jgi:hypothetical protein
MEGLEFPAHHARVLLCIAHDPDVRLSDIAASLGITEDQPGRRQGVPVPRRTPAQ